MVNRDWNELRARSDDDGKMVCVGLDPQFKLMPQLDTPAIRLGVAWPEASLIKFCNEIIDATKGVAGYFKPNMAFFARYARNGGINALRNIIAYAHNVAAGIPVILDHKLGDIDSTNDGYVEYVFDDLGADALTISPYLGYEKGLKPFFDRADKGVIVLCRTSNPGGGELQDSVVQVSDEEAQAWDGVEIDATTAPIVIKLYEKVAYLVSRVWNANGNAALVAGATFPQQLADIRAIVGGEMPLLIPGIGAQGGDLEATVAAGRNTRGTGMIINSSRGIIHASKEADFAKVAGQEAQKLHDAIRQATWPNQESAAAWIS